MRCSMAVTPFQLAVVQVGLLRSAPRPTSITSPDLQPARRPALPCRGPAGLGRAVRRRAGRGFQRDREHVDDDRGSCRCVATSRLHQGQRASRFKAVTFVEPGRACAARASALAGVVATSSCPCFATTQSSRSFTASVAHVAGRGACCPRRAPLDGAGHDVAPASSGPGSIPSPTPRTPPVTSATRPVRVDSQAHGRSFGYSPAESLVGTAQTFVAQPEACPSTCPRAP